MHAQSRPILCNPTDCSSPGSSVHGIIQACSSPGSSVHGIIQARILVWVAIFSSRGSSQFRNQMLISGISSTDRQVDSLPLCHLGSPWYLESCWINQFRDWIEDYRWEELSRLDIYRATRGRLCEVETRILMQGKPILILNWSRDSQPDVKGSW